MSIPIQHAKIQSAEAILGYTFSDTKWLWEALCTPGPHGYVRGLANLRGNQPLAGVGDAIARAILVLHCYENGFSVGETSQQLQDKQSNDHLKRIFNDKALYPCVNLNPSQRGEISGKLKAQVVEAIIGAVFQDGGMDAARRVCVDLGVVPDITATGNVQKFLINPQPFGIFTTFSR